MGFRFQAVLQCDGAPGFPSCTTTVGVWVDPSDIILDLNSHRVETVAHSVPEGWSSEYNSVRCPSCTRAYKERYGQKSK